MKDIIEAKIKHEDLVKAAQEHVKNCHVSGKLFRALLKERHPHNTLIGKPYIFTKSKWCGDARMGEFASTSFLGGDGELYLNHSDLFTSEQFSYWAKMNLVEVKDFVKPDKYYLLLTIPEEEAWNYPGVDHSNEIVPEECIGEYLFIEM